MTEVLLDYDRAMTIQYDGESPWKQSESLNPKIEEWLDNNCGSEDWDWDWGFASEAVFFKIRDPSKALLFKLTWGGVYYE